MILGVGHQSTRERLMVVREAVKMGVQRIEVNHVNYPMTWLTPEQCKQFADMGAYIGIYAMDMGNFYTMDEVMPISTDAAHVELRNLYKTNIHEQQRKNNEISDDNNNLKLIPIF